MRPEPALITSIITAGSRPAFTPIATASEVAAMAVAERKLFASFMVCAMPGLWPMTNTRPKTDNASLTTSMWPCGPDTMTASVPFLAPPTPPLTGESICTMFFFASSTQISAATRAPVVERSTKRLIFLPSMTPPSPSATFCEMASEGRLAITVSTRSATSAGEEASLRAQAPPVAPPRHCVCRRRRACGRPRSAAAPSAAHVAQPDKTDVHFVSVPSIFFARRLCPTRTAASSARRA